MPDLALGSDVIVGFPAETDDEFRATERLVKEIPFANLHVFQYSRRPGTPAANMPAQVPASVKRARSDRLIELAASKKAFFAEGLVGKKLPVLIEKITESGTVCGWTPQYIWAEIHRTGVRRNEIIDFIPSSAKNGILAGC
jgi:tRNA A37 methylthiotransferase MiaB